MRLKYTHRNGHTEILELPTAPAILDQIPRNPSLRPRPTTDRPSFEELSVMVLGDGPVPATDGCEVDPDGICPHGHVGWPAYVIDSA